MTRQSKSLSLSLHPAVAAGLESVALAEGISPSAKAADIVEDFLINGGHVAADASEELLLLRRLRDEAIDKLTDIIEHQGFSEDISLRTFQACQNDDTWMAAYRRYVRDDPYRTGNPRKTNVNQTIGSRIKSKLGASDVVDASGNPARGRAPTGTIIQTYQLLRMD